MFANRLSLYIINLNNSIFKSTKYKPFIHLQMRNHRLSLQFCTFFLLSLFLLLTHSCKDDDPTLPALTTTPITNIAQTSATAGGIITNAGGADVTAHGVCWSTNENPTTTDFKTVEKQGTTNFASTLNDLLPNTTYFVRAYASNKVGTAYGNSVTFKTLDGVIDADGNLYEVVNIGKQTWLKDNLKTTKLNDGTPLSLIADGMKWYQSKSPAYCWYDNDKETNGERYGALYNWYAVNTNKLCPTGWRVPKNDDWVELTLFIGNNTKEGQLLAAPKLKATTGWPTKGTDEHGFSAYPAGRRFYSGDFNRIGEEAYWWCAYEDSKTGWARIIRDKQEYLDLNIYNTNQYGLSVRCVRD